MITITKKVTYNTLQEKVEKEEVEPKRLFTRFYFIFQNFKCNNKIQSVSFKIECGKCYISGRFERFVAYYPCSHPVTYNLHICGQQYNCRTIQQGIRSYAELFVKRCQYRNQKGGENAND